MQSSSEMQSCGDTFFQFLPYDHPTMVHMREVNSRRSIKKPFRSTEHMNRHALGFYKNFNDLDDVNASSWIARKMACKISSYVVALSCNSSILDEDEMQFNSSFNSSGIVVEYKGTKKILTSTYIFGGRSELRNLEVDVLLPNGAKVRGNVSYADIYHNVVLIDAEIDSVRSVALSTEFVDLGAQVMSLGRHSQFGVMASRGTINLRQDDLDSDDLMSSTCIISEGGIGGPLIDQSSGAVIGMNVYISKKSTSFIPSCILSHCLECLMTNGEVFRPWLGFKAKSLNEKKLVEMDVIYQKFSSTNGIFVTKVTKGSPADLAGICVDDIITSCNDSLLSSPVELADLLLKLGKMDLGVSTRNLKRGSRDIEVIIQRPATRTTFAKIIKFQDFTSPDLNRWSVIPLDTSFDKSSLILF
ncbi:uncharacterized protein LOC141658498 [Silene latifolia]|uniref:uncharacterized protein LOC141658498 n=1 Tax=Silene latifolia TaxID=37657 RepID=UPI003D77395B